MGNAQITDEAQRTRGAELAAVAAPGVEAVFPTPSWARPDSAPIEKPGKISFLVLGESGEPFVL